MEVLVSASDYGSDVRQFTIVRDVVVCIRRRLRDSTIPIVKKVTLQKCSLCSSSYTRGNCFRFNHYNYRGVDYVSECLF